MSKEELKQELSNRMKQREQEQIEENKKTVQDPVRLHESGWKKRYYEDHHKKEDIEKNGGLKRMCVTYVQGLCWVLKYYFQGCPSWSWYYPFHYAPFASDLINIEEYPIDFELSKPFACGAAAASGSRVQPCSPDAAQWLMTDPGAYRCRYDGDVPSTLTGRPCRGCGVAALFVDENDIHGAYDAVKASRIGRTAYERVWKAIDLPQ